MAVTENGAASRVASLVATERMPVCMPATSGRKARVKVVVAPGAMGVEAGATMTTYPTGTLILPSSRSSMPSLRTVIVRVTGARPWRTVPKETDWPGRTFPSIRKTALDESATTVPERFRVNLLAVVSSDLYVVPCEISNVPAGEPMLSVLRTISKNLIRRRQSMRGGRF